MKRTAQILLGLFLLSSVIFNSSFITIEETKAEQGFSYVVNKTYDATSDIFVCEVADGTISDLPVSNAFVACSTRTTYDIDFTDSFIHLNAACGGNKTNKAFVVGFVNPIPAKRFKTIALRISAYGQRPNLNTYNVNEISDGKLGEIKETITSLSKEKFTTVSLSSELYADKDGYVRRIVFASEPSTATIRDFLIDSLELKDEQPEYVPVVVGEGYILPDKPTDCDGLFLGWELNGKLYKANAVSLESGEINPIVADFALGEGASIRLKPTKEDTGIRFIANFDKNSFLRCKNYIEEIGVIILPTDLIGDEEFTDENSGKPAVFLLKKDDELTFNNDGKIELRATIKSIRESNYGRNFSARAFLTVNYGDGDIEKVFCNYNGENARSVYFVATKAYLDKNTTETQKDILYEYLSKVANITVNLANYSARLTATEAKVNAAKSVTLTAFDENSVTLEIVAKQSFSLIVNGKEIRKENIISQSRSDDLFTFVIKSDALADKNLN